MQLLQEGIFSQPPHLFSDALDFVFDALDPSIVRIQNEPKELLKALPGLIKQEETKKRYIDRLTKLVQEYRNSEDVYIIYRLYYLISQILEPEKTRKELLSYQGLNPNVIANVRLLWPSIWRVDMHKAAQDSSFWDRVPDQVWADTLQYAIFHFNSLSIFPSLPPRFHRYFLEQFAIFSTYSEEALYGLHRIASTRSNPDWAVWILFTYQKMLIFLQEFEGRNFNLKKMLNQMLTENKASSVNYSGLSDDEQSIVAHLITISREVLEAAIAGQDQLPDALENYIHTIIKYLKQPGLTSRLAYRCALNLFFNTHTRRASFPDSNWGQTSWKTLWKDLEVFFPKRSLPTENTDEETELNSLHRAITDSPFLFTMAAPRYVRLEYDGTLVDLVDILTDHICEGKELPFDWIKCIPLTRMISPLIEKCGNCLPTLLAKISDTTFIPFVSRQIPAIDIEINIPFTRFDFNSALSAVGIQRILKVVRNTDDPKILSGGLIALSSSKFLRSAGTALTLKMLRAASNQGDIAAMHLFNQRLSKELDADSKSIIDEIAKGILESPNDYTFLITCAAAEHLASYSPVGLTPMLSMEETLNLHVHTK